MKSGWFPWFLAVPAIVVPAARWAHAKLFLTQDQALAKAFPDATSVERKTLFLTPEQIRSVQELSKTKVDSSVLTYYVGRRGQTPLGTAFFDTRVVRTMPMTFMTVVKPGGALGFVEVLAFYEPEDYLPRSRWMDLFRGRALTPALRLRRDIPNVTGASLTCQAVTDGVRQMLALYQVIP